MEEGEGENALHAIARGFSIGDYDNRGWASLHVAAARGNLEVLCCLVGLYRSY